MKTKNAKARDIRVSNEKLTDYENCKCFFTFDDSFVSIFSVMMNRICEPMVVFILHLTAPEAPIISNTTSEFV